MHPPNSESVETPTSARRAGGLPTIGGKYFALAVLFAMNLLNYVDRYSFFAVGTQIQKDLAHRRLLVRRAGRVVHDRVHDRLAGHGLAGGSLQPQDPARRRRRPLEPGDGRDGVLGRFLSHVLLAGAAGHRRGELRRDRAGADRGPLPDQASAAGRWGSITWRCRVGTALGYILGGTIADEPGLAGGLLGGRPARDSWSRSAGLVINDPGRGASEGGTSAGKADRPGLERLSRPDQDADLRVQHRRHGGRHVRDRCLRGLGLDVLPARPRPVGDARPARRSACCWSAPACWASLLGMFLPDILCKLTKRAYLLLAAIGRAGRDPAGRRRHPRPRVQVLAGLPVRGDRSCSRWCSGRATR